MAEKKPVIPVPLDGGLSLQSDEAFENNADAAMSTGAVKLR